MDLVQLSLLGIASTYLLSLLCGYVFKIQNDLFYAPFHFTGGLLFGVLFFALTGNAFFTVILTFIIGLLWELYEQIIWKFLVKKKKLRPGKQDTINDLILDTLGSVVAVFLVLNFFS